MSDNADTKNATEKKKRNRNLHIRLTDDELDFIEMVSYEYDKTKTEMVMKAMKFYHNCNKGKNG